MLLTKEVEVCLNSNNISHYASKGYKTPKMINKNNKMIVPKCKIKVNVEDLNKEWVALCQKLKRIHM